ncbi:hypothetical protein JYT72_02620, partial [Crocinitomix catalasitica]|nr:hypothetical protein [Crocinitomix catalasitica]
MAYVWVKVPTSSRKKVFLVYTASCALWQLSEAFIYLAKYETAAMYWNGVINICVIFAVAVGLHFALSFVKKINQTTFKVLLFINYVPATIFLIIHLLGLDGFKIVSSEKWNWINDTEYNVIEKTETYWIIVIALLTMFLYGLSVYHTRKENDVLKRRALILLVGFLFPALVGLTFQVAFPFGLGIEEVPVTTSSIVVFSLAAAIVLRKYQLFDFSPVYTQSKVLELMEEGVAILDLNNKIRYSNTGLSTLIRARGKNGLLNKRLDDFYTESFRRRLEEEGRPVDRIFVEEIELIAANGEVLNMAMS